MKAFTGRIGQYRILSTEKKLAKHLLETELFTEQSLYNFAEKFKSFVIKPLLGPGEICISSNNNQFQILTKPELTSIFNKEELYHYLTTYELKKAHYVIQPKKTHSLSLLSPFHYYVTLHRQTANDNWHIISKTEINRSRLGKFLYMYFLLKIEKLSILAARKLGEFFPNCRTVVIEILYDLKGGIWIKDTFLHFSRSKWSQYLSLSANHVLTPSIPATGLFTKVNFNEFLIKFNQVIIKPYDGQLGMGISQITTNDHQIYEVHSGSKKLTMASLEDTFQYLEENFLSKKYYIIQQKVPLATINDCPMDIRVITQKGNSKWAVTGKLVKLASSGFFVTNAAQKLILFKDAFHQSNLAHLNLDSLESKIEAICKTASEQLEESHPNSTIIGFDIGITPLGDIWIIEANFKPDLKMFYYLEDKSIYENISKAKRQRG